MDLLTNAQTLDIWMMMMMISSFSVKVSVRIEIDYGLDGRGSIVGRGKRCFSSPQCVDRLPDPPSLLYNGYRGPFP
jgi:hypothetical protein